MVWRVNKALSLLEKKKSLRWFAVVVNKKGGSSGLGGEKGKHQTRTLPH